MLCSLLLSKSGSSLARAFLAFALASEPVTRALLELRQLVLRSRTKGLLKLRKSMKSPLIVPLEPNRRGLLPKGVHRAAKFSL